MGVFDTYCLICGAPFYLPDAPSPKEWAWLKKLTVVTRGGQVYSTGTSIDDYGTAYYGSSKFPVNPQHWTEGQNDALVCHTNCYTLLQKELKYQLAFTSDLIALTCCHFGGLEDRQLYGQIAEYHEQVFDFEQLVNDQNQWLLTNPLLDKNRVNRDRILGTWASVTGKDYQQVRRWEKMPLKQLKLLSPDQPQITEIYNKKKTDLIYQLAQLYSYQYEDYLDEAGADEEDVADILEKLKLYQHTRRREMFVKRLFKHFHPDELKQLLDESSLTDEAAIPLIKKFNMCTDHTLLQPIERSQLLGEALRRPP